MVTGVIMRIIMCTVGSVSISQSDSLSNEIPPYAWSEILLNLFSIVSSIFLTMTSRVLVPPVSLLIQQCSQSVRIRHRAS